MVTFRWSLRFLGATKEGKEDKEDQVIKVGIMVEIKTMTIYSIDGMIYKYK